MTRLIIQANGTLFFFKKYIYNVLNNNSSFEIIYLLILIQSSSKTFYKNFIVLTHTPINLST